MVNIKNLKCPKVSFNDETIPASLKFVLTRQIKDLFKFRAEYNNYTPTSYGIGVMLNSWWKNHRKQLACASERPEFDYKSLALRFDKDVFDIPDYTAATYDYRTLVMVNVSRGHDAHCDEVPTSNLICFTPHYKRLFQLFIHAYNELVLDGTTVKKADTSPFINNSRFLHFNTFINNYYIVDNETHMCAFDSFLSNDEVLKRGSKSPRIDINKLPEVLFNLYKSFSAPDTEALCTRDEFRFCVDRIFDYIWEHKNEFYAVLYKTMRVNQYSDGHGLSKSKIITLLVNTYYNLLVSFSLTYGSFANLFSGISELSTTNFNALVSSFKVGIVSLYTDTPVKVRNNENEGYRFVNSASYEQIFARLQESVRSSCSKQNFIVSFHPCDMITCSLGYKWSSCQSFVNNFRDLFPDDYSMYTGGNTYSGMYHKGDFAFLTGNAFIAYVPYKIMDDRPLYLLPKLKRCLIWVGNELNVIVQNYFYPEQQSHNGVSEESSALGKCIREYLQDVFAVATGHHTEDWVSLKSGGSHSFYSHTLVDNATATIHEVAPGYSQGEYDDPIYKVSVIKGAADYYVEYMGNLVYLNSGRIFSHYDICALFEGSSSARYCDNCGFILPSGSSDRYCDSCNHLSSTIVVNGSSYALRNGYLKYFGTESDPGILLDKDLEPDSFDSILPVDDDSDLYVGSSVHIVHTHSSIRYYRNVPSFYHECKHCHEYFTSDAMVGDYCLNHLNFGLSGDDFKTAMDNFTDESACFVFADCDSTYSFLVSINSTGYLWASGKKPSEFIPAVGRLITLRKGKLYAINPASNLKKLPVIEASRFFKKGGDSNED